MSYIGREVSSFGVVMHGMLNDQPADYTQTTNMPA